MSGQAGNPAEAPSSAPGFAGLTRAGWCAVIVAVLVASLPAVMPVMVGAMAAQPGIGTEGAGYLVSVNMAGIFAGTLLCALVHARASAKYRIIAGLLVMMLGNLVTIAVTGMPALLAARLLSGLGEGFAAGVCFSLMAASARPGTIFAYYTAGQAVVGLVGMGTLPWLVAAFDWRAFYVVLTLVAVPALFLAGPASREGQGTASATGAPSSISAAGMISLAMIFLFFTGMALVWAFLQPIGEQQGLTLATISGALASAAIAGFAGSMAVALGGDRLRDRSAWIIGMVLVVASALGLLAGSATGFVFGAWALNFVWGFQYPFLFRMLARTDPGRGAAVTPMATGIALSVGPALGGAILAQAGLTAACAVFLIMTLGALLTCLLRGRAPAAHLLEQN
jgi:predicted MFS family arabinose efflux permease